MAALDIESLRVEPDRRYNIAGVLSAGRGLFRREPIDGSQTKYPTLHRLRAGQLVMRKLTAWEGPITCVPVEYEGFFVSAEFPTFTLGRDLLPAYMSLVCQRPAFWELMKDRSTGSVQRRKRVSPTELLDITLDVPPLAAQRRIVDLISALDDYIAAAAVEAAATLTGLETAREAWIAWADLVPLSTLCSIESRLVDPTDVDYALLPHIGIESIETRTGRLLGTRTAAEDGVTSGKYLVTEADVVYAKIRPELRKATFPSVRALCSADAYPLRPASNVDPHFLNEVLLTERFSEVAVARSGRTKMPKVNRLELLSIRVPSRPLDEQRSVGRRLQEMRLLADKARSLEAAALRVRRVALEGLLAGAREIPAAYDRLLVPAA